MTSDIVEIGGCCAGVPARLADILDTWHITFGTVGFPPAQKTVQLGPQRNYEIINRTRHLRTFLALVEPYDVLHYHCRSHFPQFLDLPLWRALGKQVWVSFHGSDIRGKQRKAANPLLRLADRIFVSTPDLLDTLPDAEWLPNPAPAQLPPAPTTRDDCPLVVHCPSRRATKGSEQITEAVSILKHVGERFEFRLLENRPHDAVLQQIQGADIVIDQAVIGMYGMVAIEAMAARKPVLAYLNGARDRLPQGCPVVNCGRAPTEIASALSACLEHQTFRDCLGHQGEEYVNRVHGAANIRRILS
jgi:hypothetical protein